MSGVIINYPKRFTPLMQALTDALVQHASIPAGDAVAAMEYAFDAIGDPRYYVEEEPGSLPMPIEDALKIARLWRVGKMIGGNEDAVRDALLAEVERLHAERTPS